MVRIPSLSRRPPAAPTRDDTGDGRTDAVGVAPAAETGPVTARDRLDESAVYDGRHSAVPATAERAEAARAAEHATAERDAATRAADEAETERLTARRAADRAETERFAARTDGDETAVAPGRPVTEAEPRVAPAGPRPRASLLATLSLVVGVVAALAVLTGALAGYGIALGVLALLLSIGGISATSRRHVAGRSEALAGLLLGLGAVVLGILAVTGSLSWLGTDTDTVGGLRQWLDSQFVNRF